MNSPTYLVLYYCSIQIAFALVVKLPNATNDSDPRTICRTTDVWTKPSWPTHIAQYCQQLLNRLEDIEPEIHSEEPPLREFLPPSLTPEPGPVAVRTPYKLINGPCTLAVTTLDSIPIGYIPAELRPGHFDEYGFSTWFNIWDDAKMVLDTCVNEQKAGITWIGKLWMKMLFLLVSLV